jgi:hypothetical protein
MVSFECSQRALFDELSTMIPCFNLNFQRGIITGFYVSVIAKVMPEPRLILMSGDAGRP